ncbi:histone H2A-like [Thalassophryne amazonica]|uniref:histone H2A-like n=1 Tax=Thalassophryne amazonica TaxID=390379 RepID=UPI001471D34E|nr:histone H2A-like [Thalassophryne amazonica]
MQQWVRIISCWNSPQLTAPPPAEECEVKTGGKARAKVKTPSSHAGLQFPVGHVHHLRGGSCAGHVGARAPIYLAAVLVCLAAGILELASSAARVGRDSGTHALHVVTLPRQAMARSAGNAVRHRMILF